MKTFPLVNNCQKIAMIKIIETIEIVGVTLIGGGTWAMLETDKMQHSH